jgi:hypothetical protein
MNTHDMLWQQHNQYTSQNVSYYLQLYQDLSVYQRLVNFALQVAAISPLPPVVVLTRFTGSSYLAAATSCCTHARFTLCVTAIS